MRIRFGAWCAVDRVGGRCVEPLHRTGCSVVLIWCLPRARLEVNVRTALSRSPHRTWVPSSRRRHDRGARPVWRRSLAEQGCFLACPPSNECHVAVASGTPSEVSIRAAAELLGVSERMLLKSELPARMVDGHWVVPAAALMAQCAWRRDGLPGGGSSVAAQ